MNCPKCSGFWVEVGPDASGSLRGHILALERIVEDLWEK